MSEYCSAGESRCLRTINTSKIILDHLSACWHQSSKSYVAAQFIQFRLWRLLFGMQEAIVADDCTSYLGVYHIFGFGMITVSGCERVIFVASCLFRLMANCDISICFSMFLFLCIHSKDMLRTYIVVLFSRQWLINSVNQKPWLSQILVVKCL